MRKILLVLFLLWNLSSPAWAVDWCADASIVGCFPSESTEAAWLDDNSSNGNDLTNTGAVFSGGKFTFDGSDDLTNTGATWSSTGDWTMYVKIDNGSTETSEMGVFSSRSTVPNKGICLKNEQWDNSGKVGLTFFSVADYTSSSNSPIDDAFIFAVHDDSANKLYIYVNGVSSEINVGSVVAADLNGFVVGSLYRGNAYSARFNGDIYETSLWTDVLDSTDISDITTNGLVQTAAARRRNMLIQ